MVDFIVLEEWIWRINEAVDKWTEIRNKMVHSSDDCRSDSESDPESDPESDSESDSEPEPASESESEENLGPEFSPAPYLTVKEGTPCLEDSAQLGILLQSLPTEILHEIIRKAQDFDPHIQSTLSQVNQFFRTFVTASPLLWSKLDLMCPLSTVSLSLQQSANATLDVTADQGLFTDPSPVLAAKDSTRATAFYEIIGPHRHRIRCLKIRAPSSHSLERKNQNDTQPHEESAEIFDDFLWSSILSNLEYLELAFGAWEDYRHSQRPTVTKLQELRLYGPSKPWITFLVSPSLKHLTLGDHPQLALGVVRDILLSTPALESLTFSDVILASPQQPASDDAVSITSLTSLSVIRSSSDTIKRIVETVACGGVHELSINFTGRELSRPGYDWRSFHPVNVTGFRMFSTPLPRIRKLDLVSCEGDPSFLETTLNYLPGLKQLKIASAALTNRHLKVLVVQTLINGEVCEPIRCPQLISLTIENEPLIGSKIIRYIARSRNEASFPLRSVTLRGLDAEKVSQEDLQCIRDSGVIDLTVTVFDKDNATDSEDSEWSSVWITDEESEDGLASGDEDVIAES
ncbi:hypothetical protein FRC01_009679 [Tulasnella sp. 417]|nr:hypothetical protein FRC01_009679 [Tulasnella sp. 417]